MLHTSIEQPVNAFKIKPILKSNVCKNISTGLKNTMVYFSTANLFLFYKKDKHGRRIIKA